MDSEITELLKLTNIYFCCTYCFEAWWWISRFHIIIITMLYKQFHMPTIQYRAVEFILLCKHKTKFKIGYNACRKFSSFTAGQVCNKLPAYKLLCSSLSSRVIFSGSTSRHLKEIRLKWVLESPFDYCILTRTPYNVKGSCRFFHKWRQFPQKRYHSHS